MRVELRTPCRADLPAYRAALDAGYAPSSTDPEARVRELARIDADADVFVAGLDDPEAMAGAVVQPDGSVAPRLPGFVRWIFAPDFAGSIGLRWQPGTEALPSHVLGHIGYKVVPLRRNLGIATRALALMLPEAWAHGLRHVDLTTAVDNVASQRVILRNGGILIERFRKPASHGGSDALRYRISPTGAGPCQAG